MAEISHGAFRRLVADFGGCDWFFTEMLSAGAVTNNSPYSPWYLDFGPSPERTIVQLAGNEPDLFAAAAGRLSALPIAGVDINMGCSVHKIRKKGWGIELMKDRDLAASIIDSVRPRLSGQSLSVKIRIGHSEDPERLLGFCRTMIDAGVDFITLNPRTVNTNRDRPGDWNYIKLLRNELKVPIVGNGEIKDSDSLRRRMSIAGTGPLMIGRGAVQSPWIFHRLKGFPAAPAQETSPLIRNHTVLPGETVQRFLHYLELYQPADFRLSRARRFFYYFCDNFKFGTRMNTHIQNAAEISRIGQIFFSYLERNPQEQQLNLAQEAVSAEL